MFQWRKMLVSSLLVSGMVSFFQEDANAQSVKLEKPAVVSAETINMYKKTTDYSIKGKGIFGAKINVSITDGKNKIVSKSDVKEDGTFEVPVNFSTLKDGKLTVSIVQTKDGKTSNTIKQTIVKDIKAPAKPTLNSNNKSINSKNQSAYIIKGKAEPLSSVYISLGDNKTVISQKGKADSKGNFTLKFDLRKLQEGNINVSVKSRDAAGNQSNFSKEAFLTKDSSVEEPVIFSEEYVNSFNVESYPIAGTGSPGEKVKVVVKDGAKAISSTSKVDELGNYNVELNLTSLKEGKLTVEAKQIDKAGNKSKVVKEILKKDISIPSPAKILNKDFINGDTEMTSYAVFGKGVAGSDLEVTLSDGVNEVSSLGTVEENGDFSVEVDVNPLSDGNITLSVVQISPAGNVAKAETATILKDTIASDNLALSTLENINESNVNSYSISGTGDTSSIIYITVTDGKNSLFNKIKTDKEGKFTKLFDLTSLSKGNITLVVQQQDEFGNISQSKTVTAVKEN